MKKLLIAALLALMPGVALAQSITALPVYIQNNIGTVTDFGNGPTELRIVQGSAQIFTSQATVLGTTAVSTAVTLAATPAIPPCVGCFISGGSIPANATVAAYNGTTGITLSAAATAAASGVSISYGGVCSTTPSAPTVQIQAGVSPDLPLFTAARVCGNSVYAAGATVLPFAIGAH